MKKSIVLLFGIFLLSALTLSFSACNAAESTSESNEIQDSQSESSATANEKQYAATLDVNGGEPLVQSEFFLDYGDFFVFVTPERTGYTFLGWYDGEEKLKGTVWKFTEDKTFVAKWQINQYWFAAVCDQTEGQVGGTETGNYDYGTEISVTASQPNLGYSFIGWYLGETKVSEESNYVFSLGASDTVLTANYTVRKEMQVFEFTSSLTECAVTGIKDKSITEISLPEYVTSIAAGAFSGCSQVEKMTIPFVGNRAGVTASDTDQYPFGYIFGTSGYTGGTATEQYYYGYSTNSTTYDTYYIPSSLKNVTVTGGNILYGSFYNCSGLTSVTIGNGVTSIGSSAFENCIGLTGVFINDLSAWCKIQFNDCLSNPLYYAQKLYLNNELVTNLVIPNGVTSIGSYAFYGCRRLTSITIGNGVTRIGISAFSGCSGLTGVYICDFSAWCKIQFDSNDANPLYYAKKLYLNNELVTDLVIPDNVTSIGSYAFSGCSGLTNVTIPDSVMSIGSYAFSGCSGLTSVTIPDSVANIGSYAFQNCSGLTSVTIPDSVTSIGISAFYGTAYYNNESNWQDSVLYIGKHLIKAKTSLSGNYEIKSGTLTIADYAFYGCSGLTSVTIPNSVTSIGSDTFWDCRGLTSVTIPNSVTSIGSYTFYGCSRLTSVTIPDSVTSIGSDAFYGCIGLTNVTIPDSVTSIGISAFCYCSKLTSVSIGNGVTSIGSYAFSGCSGLTSVTIPDSVTSIGINAFKYCSGLNTVYYAGTKMEWNRITIDPYNNSLINATRYYYCETEPALSEDGSSYDDNYWHYDTDGVTPVIWVKKDNIV